MNTVILTGNLGQDPEILFSNEGMMIATFSIAFRSTKDKTGWIKVTCFKKTAELVEKFLHKGARVGVTGILDHEKWETDSGDKRSMHKVIANSIEFIKTRTGSEDDADPSDGEDH